MAALKIEATANTGNLRKKISNTQRLVAKSVATVHRFASELRPAMLDDLGLVPALLAFMKEFGKRKGLQIHFTASAADKIEQLNNVKRTMLYRVAQEALTNITKHAQASQAKVSINIQSDAICMTVSDNGKSFDVNRAIGVIRRRSLGILGMRERVEMVSGTFAIESVKGKGTTVQVKIPLRNHGSTSREREG
ncbi:MAG: sensor histidine kinase [Bacteroidota bacterium]